MYLYCQKCATIEHAKPAEIEEHTTFYHMHNNAWWPMQYLTDADAMAALDHEAVSIVDQHEPKYTQAAVDARREAKGQQQRPESARVPDITENVSDIDWNAELAILLKEGK